MAIPGRYRILKHDTLAEAEANGYFDNNMLGYVNGVLHIKEDDVIRPVETVIGIYPFVDVGKSTSTLYLDYSSGYFYRYQNSIFNKLYIKTTTGSVINDSSATGETVTDALDSLDSAITTISEYQGYALNLFNSSYVTASVIKDNLWFIPSLVRNTDVIPLDKQGSTINVAITGQTAGFNSFCFGYSEDWNEAGIYEVTFEIATLSVDCYDYPAGSIADFNFNIGICRTNGVIDGSLIEIDSLISQKLKFIAINNNGSLEDDDITFNDNNIYNAISIRTIFYWDGDTSKPILPYISEDNEGGEIIPTATKPTFTVKRIL